jgi:SAM-dependent methyltransferase
MKATIVKSPLVPEGKAIHVRDIAASRIVKGYKAFGIDTASIFSNTKRLSIYRCESSSYEFFQPYGISGDSKFYEKLQGFKWYYMPWKWEHEVALSYLENGQKILEVGCAHGAFLKGANIRFNLPQSIGLELNETAPADEKTFKIINLIIEEFIKDNEALFDVACSFQVLEHVYDVHSFLEAKVRSLKKKGKLLISVPNNESFVGNNLSVLNMPPHHVGLWNAKSLMYLEKLFPIKLLNIHYEPLQEYHIESHIHAMHYARHSKWASIFMRRLDKLSGRYQKILRQTTLEREKLIGHTIFAVYEKY